MSVVRGSQEQSSSISYSAKGNAGVLVDGWRPIAELQSYKKLRRLSEVVGFYRSHVICIHSYEAFKSSRQALQVPAVSGVPLIEVKNPRSRSESRSFY